MIRKVIPENNNVEFFGSVLELRIEEMRSSMLAKGAEYRTEDCFHNFKAAALSDRITTEEALWGMFMKHFISIQDMVKGIKKPTADLIDEKIKDAINYLALLEGIMIERLIEEEYYDGFKRI